MRLTCGRITFWGYTGMLLASGGSGIFIAPWELAHVFGVPVDTLDAPLRATVLNQYRFLKSAELAFGLFCVWQRQAIFQAGSPAARAFLAGVLLGVFARVLSAAIDGWPHPAFMLFAALELLTAFCVWRESRHHPENRR